MFLGHFGARETPQKRKYDFKRPMRSDCVTSGKYVHEAGCLLADPNFRKVFAPRVVKCEKQNVHFHPEYRGRSDCQFYGFT